MRAYTRLALACLALLTPTLAFADKSYKREWLDSQGLRLETKLKAAKIAARPLGTVKSEAQAALAKGNADQARNLFAEALKADPKDWTLWNGYADASSRITSKDWQVQYDARQNAVAAAYMAYQKAASPKDEAAALAMLGTVYQTQESWRSSLDAFRASLKLDANPSVQQTWTILREKYGFRLVDYKLDSDAANPRVCFNFSESLSKTVSDYSPYVVVQGIANPAITAENAQLCVDGLEHGKRYSVVVRQGLPSSVEEDLLKASDYDFYVKDRSPNVHFTGKNYVLPRTGQEGLPVVTVNARQVGVEIYRIGDRNLIAQVRGSDFMTNLSPYQAETLRDESGQKIWEGKLAVGSELNKDVTTAFPVLEAVGKMEPGLYVMTAKVEGAKSSDEDYESQATQWFVVSDFGLTALSGSGGMDVMIRSLGSAKALEGVEVRLLARNNEILQTRKTDAEGRVKFDPGLTRGKGGMEPAIVVASDGNGDYGFLDLGNEAFDLTDRGDDGLPSPSGLDAFVYPERGVYRSGETVNITTLLRDVKANAVAGVPLTLVMTRPDGVEYKREIVKDQGLGGRAWSVALLNGAPTGTWHVNVYSDPKRDAIGETSFLLEDYVAERIDLQLTPVKPALDAGQPAEVKVKADYLYGAAASDLSVQGSVRLEAAPGATVPALKGFSVGLDDETVEAATQEMEEAVTTDEKGEVTAKLSLPQVVATKPLQAVVSLSISEEGGRAVTRELTLPVLPERPVIGVKKLFEDVNLTEGTEAKFEVLYVSPSGEKIARKGMQWELKKVTRRYQWFNSEGRWDYEVIRNARRVANGTFDTTAAGPSAIAAHIDWGSYVLEVSTGQADGAVTTVAFSVGWGAKDDVNAPDVLDVKLDKEAYADGETMKVHLSPRFDGTATVMVVSDHVEMSKLVDVSKSGSTVELTSSRGWGTGAYVLAIAHRPMDVSAHRMPGRAIGLAWFQVDKDAHKIGVSIDMPDMVRPRGPVTIPMTFKGLAAGEEARVVVAAVDIGILNLTGYKTPDPETHYNGQRVLGTQVRDLYGFLIDGMQGARGAISSGGDEGTDTNVSPPREAPLARYSGVVTVGPDGKASVTFDLPAFNGAIRVMAVAWSKERVGHAAKDVVVRDPIVVQSTLPRFLHVGDQSRLHLAIDNVEGEAGDYIVDLDVHGPLTIPAAQLRATVKLAKKGKAQVVADVTGVGIGTGTIDARLTGPGGIDARQALILNVQPATPFETKRSTQPIAENGGSITLTSDMAGGYLPATAVISLAISPYGAFDVPALLKALDRYPYGCSEQLVSRAMPLLYANKLAAEENLALDEAIDDRIKTTVAKLLTRQTNEGSFGLWGADGDDAWLTAYVADFLTRARERGFEVPQSAFESALSNLRNYVVNNSETEKADSHKLAYAAYVLARNGRPVIGDLRYLVDNKLSEFTTPLGQAQIGAALALLGDKTRAQPVFTSAIAKLDSLKTYRNHRVDYGTTLRDGAALMALMAESGLSSSQFQKVAQIVEEARAQTRYSSTQEQAWMVLAATALLRDSDKLKLEVDGQEKTGPLYRSYRALKLDGKPVTVRNVSATPAQMVVTLSGNPIAPLPEASEGYKIERTFHKLDGTKIDLAKVKQTDRVVVVLKLTEPTADDADLLVVDNLPAGFEIDNPKLAGGKTDLDAFDWLESSVEADHTEYRDDRFIATFKRAKNQSAFFHIAYTVRAVSPGKYVLPAATAEDMYRPWRFGRTATGTVDIAPMK